MRLFLGIDVSELKLELERLQKKFSKVIDASFVTNDKFHLTVNFIGKNNPHKVSKKINSVNQKRFEAATTRLGVFPNITNPKVLWLGANPHDELHSLHVASNIALGNKTEKYTPHITLGRIKKVHDSQKFIELLNEEVPKYTFNVNKFVLFSSNPTSFGHVYTKIKDYHLRKE